MRSVESALFFRNLLQTSRKLHAGESILCSTYPLRVACYRGPCSLRGWRFAEDMRQLTFGE